MSDKNYITFKGLKKLTDEIEFLLRKERPRIVAIVSWAASLGDRSENADYQYGKRRLREIDSRLRFLTKRVENSSAIEPIKQKSESVIFGATVRVSDEEGNFKIYSIVGQDESNPQKNLISWKSPIGKALLGKKVGDEVTIQTPSGLLELSTESIEYVDLDIDSFIE